MDHPDDHPHGLLDPSLPHQESGLDVLSNSFDHAQDGQSSAQPSPSAAAAAAAAGQQQQLHHHQPQDYSHAADGSFQGDLQQDFGQQQHGDHPTLDGGMTDGRPTPSDDGQSAAGSSKRRPHNSAELDLSTPEGQAKKKQRAVRAAYMREYRKKKSLGKAASGSASGKDENGLNAQYDDVIMGMGGTYDTEKLKQLDLNVDPTISGQGGFGYGQMAVNLHNAGDAAFHDELPQLTAGASGGGGAHLPRFTTFTHPPHLGQLPLPRLKFLFHLELELDGPPRDIGEGPHGKRLNAVYKGGLFEGPSIRGIVLSGGSDSILVDPATSESRADARYVLQTHDGAAIYAQATGVQSGPKDVLDSLGDNTQIPASSYSYRLNVTLETGDERYKWLNRAICIASAARSGNLVVYDCYQLA